MKNNDFIGGHPLKTFSINETQWHYIDSGTMNKPVLLLLHGTRGNPYVFWKQFNALEGNLRLIAVKLPLLHDVGQISHDLLALMQSLSIDHFNLLGASIGGYLTQWFCFHHPKNVGKLFICNAIVDGEDVDNPSLFFSKYILPQIPYFLIKKKFLKAMRREDPFYADINNFIEKYILPGLSSREFSERALSFYSNGRIPDLNIPEQNIIIIDSDDDPYISKEGQQKVLEKYPNAEHIRFHRAHHFPYILQAEKFNTIVLDELSKINK